MNSTTAEIRRTNLKNLIEARGGPKLFAEKLGYVNASFLVQMCGPNPTRNVSERTARRIEETLNLPQGYLDDAQAAASPVPVLDSSVVRDSIQLTAKAIEDAGMQMSPTKIGTIASMVYDDAALHGRVRVEYITQLIRLLA